MRQAYIDMSYKWHSSKKIVELPVYYRARKYGTTNISRFKDGWKLIFYFLNSYFLFKLLESEDFP